MGQNIAQDLISNLLESLLEQNKIDNAVHVLSMLVARTCTAMTTSEETCEKSYQCAWDGDSQKCTPEKCAFLPDRKTCENSPAQCVFFGGGATANNPFPVKTSGLKNMDGYNLEVKGAGCYASPCRVAKTANAKANDIDPKEAEKKCMATSYTVNDREYSCVMDSAKPEQNKFLTGQDLKGCHDKYLNGNKKMAHRKNLGQECYRKNPWRKAKKFNKGKCSKPGACPAFCGAGMCCKKGDPTRGCPAKLIHRDMDTRWRCVDTGPRATEFIYL